MNPALRSPGARRLLFRRGLLAAGLVAALAACESGGHRPAPDAGGPGEGGVRAAVPRMEARAAFFDGQIEAEVLLARVGAPWKRGDETAPASGHRGRSGGFSGRVGGFGGGRGGHRGDGGERGAPEGGGGDDEQPRAPIHASNLPAAALRLRLTNQGDAPVSVEVIDFDSSLGDFVVEPAKLTLPPGQPTEAEPMISRLGVGTAEIPLTVRLRLGGRSEQQVLTLRVVVEPAPTAPAAGPPSPPRPEPPNP